MNKAQGITFIGAGTRLEGEMTLESAALVSGELKGKISSAGQIKIEPQGLIDGELDCHELRVCGTFRGQLRCQKLVIVHGGVVEGEVASNEMEIFDGGQFLGSRTRGPEAAELPVAPSAVLPREQGKSPLRLVVGLAAVVGLGWLIATKTPLIETLSNGLQAMAAPSVAPEAADRAPLPEMVAADTSAGFGVMPVAASDTMTNAGYFTEDPEAMEAGNALLLEQAFSDTQAEADVQAPLIDEAADQAEPLTTVADSSLEVDVEASALGTQGAADLSGNRM